MRLISRKKMAQVGVISWIASTFMGFVAPYLQFFGSQNLLFLPLGLLSLWPTTLIIASLMPTNKEEVWGSIFWPLVGYDNAIDAIYVSGPWRMRFAEMDEIDREKTVTIGMTTLFSQDTIEPPAN